MKNKFVSIAILFFILILYFSVYFISNKPVERKILKVVEADKYFVDFNSNNKIDSDELVRLRDVIAISPIKNPYTIKIADNLDISIEEYMKTGYLARKWAKENFEGKTVKICEDKVEYTNYERYRVITGTIDGINPAEVLLSNGFAVLYPRRQNYGYIQYYNFVQIIKNISLLKNLNFVFLNSYSGKVHKLNCDHVKNILYGELFLDEPEYKIFSKCKLCFNNKYTPAYLPDIPVAYNKYGKSLYKKFGEIELYLINPYEFNKPNNKTEILKRLLNEINLAKESIDIALYGFSEQDEIMSALKNARNRGVKIRTVLDYSKKSEEIYPGTLSFAKEFDARFDKTENLMHNKFFIFDNKKVITGSMNISPGGSGGYNENVVVVLNSSDVAGYYKSEFDSMYSGKFQKFKNKITKNDVKFSNSSVSVYFSPKDDVYNSVISPLLESAKDEIYISAFYLTYKPMVSELINARNRGVNIIILCDAVGAFNFKNIIYELRNANIPVKVENWGGKNHEKTIMIDSNILLTGSSNFSRNGFEYNDENIVVINNSEIAKFWKDYFLFLFNKIDNKYLYKIPRAESFDSINSCNDGIDNNFDGKIDSEDSGCISIKK